MEEETPHLFQPPLSLSLSFSLSLFLSLSLCLTLRLPLFVFARAFSVFTFNPQFHPTGRSIRLVLISSSETASPFGSQQTLKAFAAFVSSQRTEEMVLLPAVAEDDVALFFSKIGFVEQSR